MLPLNDTRHRRLIRIIRFPLCRMLHRYFRPCSSAPTSIADDTGLMEPVLYDWPLLADFKAMRLADYNWLLAATAQQVR
jgi:hypothetical protein